jgi:hypothetical protein
VNTANDHLRQSRIHPLFLALGFACGLAALDQIGRAATTVCVHDAGELQTALTAAQGSTSETFIDVAQGTYSPDATLTFYSLSTNQGQLDVSGGYDSSCTTTTQNPALTLLDGGGLVPVLNLESWNGISVRYLTVQNGHAAASGGSGGLTVESITGGVIVHYNIIRNNYKADYYGGIFASIAPDDFSTASTANIDVSGNLIVDNTAGTDHGGGIVSNDGTGKLFMNNNTVSGNIVVANGVGLTGGVFAAALTSYISNNILYGDSANTCDLKITGTTVLDSNDIQNQCGSADPSSSGNVNFDPQFVSATDFHVLATSVHTLGQGTLTPPGGVALATIDLEGHPRTANGMVDMGAYERDYIFNDGFDD